MYNWKHTPGIGMLRRTLFLMAVCGIASFLLLIWRLYELQITEHEKYESLAVSQQLRELENEREALEREKRVLSVRIEESLSLSEIERRASGELGMRPCRGDQIEEIGIDGESDAYK